MDYREYNRNRAKRATIKISPEDKALLETLSKRHKLPMTEIAGYLIGLCDKYDLLAGDWKDRLAADDEDRKVYAALDDACPAMGFAENYYVCVWGRDGSPPAIKKLARDIDQAFVICDGCKKTLAIKMENESLQVKIQELEAKVSIRSTEKFKIPVCSYGGILGSDAQSFTSCRLNPAVAVSISDYCKKRMNGKACSAYSERLVGVGSKV